MNDRTTKPTKRSEWKAQTHHMVNTKNGKCNVIDLNGPMFLVVDGVNNFREQQRIAALIATAPEMLEMLQLIRLDGYESRALNALIARARGESHE